MTTTIAKPQTPQEAAFEGLLRDVLNKVETRFSELETAQVEKFKGAAGEIARLRDDLASAQQNADKRLQALMDQEGRGEPYRGAFGSEQAAADTGRLVLALVALHRAQPIPEACKAVVERCQRAAAVDGGTGGSGGFGLIPEIIRGIIRNVEEYGVLDRNATRWPTFATSGSRTKRTGGVTVSYPDLGASAPTTNPTTGKIQFAETKYAAYVPIDDFMLDSEMVVALGEWIAQELAYAFSYTTDLNGFVGDGTSTYAKTVGLFKRAGASQLVVTADSGDETFEEVAAANVKYLAKALGKLPQFADQNAKFYLHRTQFWNFLGSRDSQNRPVADILTTSGRPQNVLMGYPAEMVQVAPSTTAVSTVMAIVGDLRKAVEIFRHRRGARLRSSEHVEFYKGQLVLALDMAQDIVEVDPTAYVQIKTAAS